MMLYVYFSIRNWIRKIRENEVEFEDGSIVNIKI